MNPGRGGPFQAFALLAGDFFLIDVPKSQLRLRNSAKFFFERVLMAKMAPDFFVRVFVCSRQAIVAKMDNTCRALLC